MDYIALHTHAELPALENTAAFKAILIADLKLDRDTQYRICDWLLAAGCVYVMVTGRHVAGWTQMLDATNLARFDFSAIPDQDVIIATEHAGEPLSDVAWFSRYSAMHPMRDLADLACVHITTAPDEAAIRAVLSQGE